MWNLKSLALALGLAGVLANPLLLPGPPVCSVRPAPVVNVVGLFWESGVAMGGGGLVEENSYIFQLFIHFPGTVLFPVSESHSFSQSPAMGASTLLDFSK